MAKGDYDATALNGMARQNADPQAAPYTKAKNALRVASQISAAELQFCIAFDLDPFSYLAAKLAESDAIAAERQGRIDTETFRERELQQREAWGRGVIGASA